MGKPNKKSKKNGDEIKEKEFDIYKKQFNSEEERLAHSIVMLIAFSVAIYYLFHINKFLAVFYKPNDPTWKVSFDFIIMLADWTLSL